jgi:hypothetical protein
MVDLHASPMRFGDHHSAAWANDTPHLADAGGWIFKVHQHALAMRRVKARVRIWQGVRIASVDAHVAERSDPFAGVVDKRLRKIDADNLAPGSDCVGEQRQENASATADFKDAFARLRRKRIQATHRDFAYGWHL